MIWLARGWMAGRSSPRVGATEYRKGSGTMVVQTIVHSSVDERRAKGVDARERAAAEQSQRMVTRQ